MPTAKSKTTALIRGWISALFCVLCIQACNSGTKPSRSGGANGKQAQKPVPVAVTRATIGEAVSYYVTTATLEAEHHAAILSRTTGVVLHLFHEEGDVVEENQVLLQIEDDDQRLKLKQAEINLQQLEQEHQRRIKMWEAKVLSPQEFEGSENGVIKARAELEVAQLNLSYTKVRAPFSGQIVRRNVELGAQVQPGTPVFEIMDVDPLLARVHIPANRMGRVNIGQTMHLTLDSNGEEMTGDIRLISPIVNPDTGTVKITAEVHDYPPGTRPGDFAEVRVVTDKHENTLLVPSVAVFEELGRQIVFVANDNKAEKRVVEVGFVESGTTEILTGIQPQDLIVIKGQRDLRDGMPLEILEGPANSLSLNAMPRKGEVSP